MKRLLAGVMTLAFAGLLSAAPPTTPAEKPTDQTTVQKKHKRTKKHKSRQSKVTPDTPGKPGR